MRRFKVFFLIIIIFSLSTFLFSQEKISNLECYIKLNNNSFSKGEPIIAKFFVKNISNTPVEIIISDKFYFNFTFLVRDLQNRVLKEKREFYFEKEDSKNFQISKSIKIIEPGEYYGTEIDLSKLYNFQQKGFYIIQGYFFPIPYNISESENAQTPLVKIYIKDDEFEDKTKKQDIEKEAKPEMVVDRDLTPWETMEFIIKAKIEKEWNKLFLYIDLEQLIQDYDEHEAKYNKQNLTLSQKEAIIENFKEDLKTILFSKEGEKIDSFVVMKTLVDNNKGLASVSVNIYYTKINDFVYGRNYTFKLYKKNKQWYLYKLISVKK